MIVAYTSLLIIVITFELLRQKSHIIDFLSLFHLFFVFIYILPSAFYLLFPTLPWKFLALCPQAVSSTWIYLTILLFYFSVVFGFTYADKSIIFSRSFQWHASSHFMNSFLWFSLLLSIGIFFVYASSVGGIISLIVNSSLIRKQEITGGAFQYCAYFSNLLSSISVIAFGRILGESHRSTGVKHYIFFLVASIFSILQSLGTGGRGAIIMTVLPLYILYLNASKRSFHKILLSIAMFSAAAAMIIYGKQFLWALPQLQYGLEYFMSDFVYRSSINDYSNSNSQVVQFSVSLLRNFDHHICSIYNVIEHPSIYQCPRLFFDWPRALLDALPNISSGDLNAFVSSTPSAINRDFLGVDGYVPPGWIAIRLMNGWLPWVGIGGLLSGAIGGLWQKSIEHAAKRNTIALAVYTLSSFCWINWFLGCDPFMFFLQETPKLFFLLVFLSKFRFPRNTN